MFIRVRPCYSALILGLAAALVAFDARAAAPTIKVMSISPAPLPVPALGNRLLPMESELLPGDAAPIYLRLAAGVTADAMASLESTPKPWLLLAVDQFPVNDARAFLKSWRPKLAQLNYGAHRESCSWQYTIFEEREHIPDLVLADAQSMQSWAKLLAVQARLQIAEHDPAGAAKTIQTGMAFSRHVADGPFFINVLIGCAAAHFMLDQVDDLISQPGAPSLYWSLTALPRPLLGLRKSMDQEYKICERLLPEMTDLEVARSDGEWSSRLASFHERIKTIRASYELRESAGGFKSNLVEFKAWVLPHAKAYFQARQGKVVLRNDDEMILKFFGARYRDLYDDIYKAGYLPYFEALPFYDRGKEQLSAVKDGLLSLFARLIASIESVHSHVARHDRKVAMLRVVEALRLHAGATGRLPASLAEVKVVPIPTDPLFGNAFEYVLSGETAELTSAAQEDKNWLELTYRITLRK